jgi:hypothetical protein
MSPVPSPKRRRSRNRAANRKKVEIAVRAPQAHSAAWLGRLRLRGPSGDSPSLWLVPRRSRPSTVLRERRVQFVASGFPIV